MDEEIVDTASSYRQTPEQERQELRMACLQVAQECHSPGAGAELLIDAAKKIEAYVTGEASK